MSNETPARLTLAAIKEKLANSRGPRYWRSYQELAETPEFMDTLADELPQATRTADIHMDRRQFLTLGGASLALAGLSGCRYLPQAKLVPYVIQPENLTPSIPLFYSSSAPTFRGYGIGTLVTAREGRPVKLDGNPGHPASLGGLDAITQASILSLYDPDRAQTILYEGNLSDWQEFSQTAQDLLHDKVAKKGVGVRFLSETVTSPTLTDQMESILALMPQAEWVQYEPANHDNILAGALAVYGQPVNTHYDLSKAKRIVALDADFLYGMPGSVRYAHDFIAGRKVRTDTTVINRLYAIESSPALSGAVADHRLRVRASEVEGLVMALASQLGLNVQAGTPVDADADKFLSALAADLQSHPGESAIIPGEFTPPPVHALAHAMNEKLGNIGKSVIISESVASRPAIQTDALKKLVNDMRAGSVDVLIILGGNPVYNAPADLGFKSALGSVAFRAHLSLYENETSAYCQWNIPEAHYLEGWGDIRAYDGTASIIQPLIQPLYDGKSASEFLSGLFDVPQVNPKAPSTGPRDGFTIVRQYWAAHGYPWTVESDSKAQPLDFDFNRLLHDGVIPNTQAKNLSGSLKVNPSALTSLSAAPKLTVSGDKLEVMIRPDPTLWDGEHANNGWLQELPKPFTKITWDNVALINPETAEKLNIPLDMYHGDIGNSASPMIQVSMSGNSVTLPAWVVPGHPKDSITIFLGYGRTAAGHVGNGTGFDVYPLFSTGNGWNGLANVSLVSQTYNVATTQFHFVMGGRDLVRAGSITEFLKDPSMAPNEEAKDANLAEGTGKRDADGYQPYPWPKPGMSHEGAYNWGMSIDLQSCIGCNACLLACQSENNIPVVGKDQVMRGRHMNWIRLDTYYESVGEHSNSWVHNPDVYFQPLTCMQCEQAPCEPVCPVGATIHSEEGINQMVYNRCIGTRYCSNNCPYKVRHFNFLNYNNHFNKDIFGRDMHILRMVFNPEVTVRGRGVMEKCMYCIQRIDDARQKAEIENRDLRDGEIVTACQQACPTKAIVFGNVTDHASKVYALKMQPHDYGLLTELNTRPRTTYLARISNPNTELNSATTITEKQVG